ncbi:MAG TPA: LLM class flavin-dependent oxidoreductase [Candidatus Limnocylindrales bacterium]|nr:LLM class flavin-dependent oxidoreductase [Candidatus Limnocylindrales bacterium]
MARLSYCHIPAYDLQESINILKTADECGFYAAYSVDETWWKDMWLLFAAAADKTSQIRMGPNVTHVILRDPAHVAQMAATLDQLTNGRAEVVVSFGNISMLPQHGFDYKGTKPLTRVIEGREVMRTLLDSGAVTYEGEYFKYAGLWTLARPVQEKMPIKIGAMGGPRSFEVGGELFDGVHQAIGTSRETYQYMVDCARRGAEKAGRNVDDLDLGAWLVMACMEDSSAAKETARIMVAFYLSAMPEQQLNRHGISGSDLKPIFDAFGAGDVAKALELTTPELGEKFSVAGTPEEVVERLQRDILSTGVNHVISALVDPYLVKAFTGIDIDNGMDTHQQLRLMRDRVMPAIA